jgi:acyl-CoA synthetase (AMP-forming)/AMP-acid ligase II
MYTLTESDALRQPERLHEAWDRPETFAFISEKNEDVGEWVRRSLELLPPEIQEHHFALLTSGSTGQPKIIIGPKKRSEALVETLHELQDSHPVEQTILALPLSYSYAFVNQWLWSRRFHRHLIATRGFAQPDELGHALDSARNAMICLVGVQVPLLSRFFEGREFPGVIRVHFAGGRFPQEKLSVVASHFPEAQIFNNYGCAEAMPRLTLRKAEAADEATDIGQPLPGVELSTDETGQLVFRSRYGAVGIIDEKGFTPVTPEMWVGTGDLGAQTERGTWKLAGRASEVFKRHGEKVSLYLLLTAVHRAWHGQAAFYREADKSGEEGHVLALAPSPKEEDVRAILQVFRKDFARAHWPLRIESMGTLPLLPNGKVNAAGIPAVPDRQVHWQQRI